MKYWHLQTNRNGKIATHNVYYIEKFYRFTQPNSLQNFLNLTKKTILVTLGKGTLDNSGIN